MPARIKSGLEALIEQRGLPRLKGKKAGLLCHHASVDSHLRHAIQLLRDQKIHLMALFAPEHGLWGTAQDQVPIQSLSQKHPPPLWGRIQVGGASRRFPPPSSPSPIEGEGIFGIDSNSQIAELDAQNRAAGVPIYSLYGDHRCPTEESLQNVDLVICDLQDVGSRYYTFVWTMALAMQVCAKFNRPFIVLDRPNPLGGDIMEGPILDLNFASFVGLYPVPVRHGLTIGELALWLNTTFSIGADLEVIPMKGWKRSMIFSASGLPWVLPSPNMPTLDTALVYPGMCLIEGTNLSEGRGTTRPFEIIGAPFILPESLSSTLNQSGLPGVIFRPCWFEPTFHKFKGEPCGGIQIHVTDRQRFKPFLTGLVVIQTVHELYPDHFAWRQPPYEYEKEKLPIDILCGTDEIRKVIEKGGSLTALAQSWQKDLKNFARQRQPYLLYN